MNENKIQRYESIINRLVQEIGNSDEFPELKHFLQLQVAIFKRKLDVLKNSNLLEKGENNG